MLVMVIQLGDKADPVVIVGDSISLDPQPEKGQERKSQFLDCYLERMADPWVESVA